MADNKTVNNNAATSVKPRESRELFPIYISPSKLNRQTLIGKQWFGYYRNCRNSYCER